MMLHSLLSALLIFTLVFIPHTLLYAEDDNTESSDVRDDTQFYHLYDNIDIVSTLKFQYDRPRIVVKSVYPQLETADDNDQLSDEMDATPLDNFNQRVVDLVQQTVATYKAQVVDFTKSGNPFPKAKNDLYIDYDTSFILSGKNPILSIRFSIQGIIVGMAHPYHQHIVLNYNLNDDREIELTDLFDPKSNYLAVLAEYSRSHLSKHLRDKSLIDEGTTPTPEHFKNWNIKPNGLLITFDESTVAPYVDGAQSVLIPYSALKDVIALDSPIASCIKNKRHCRSHHVVTGGFIDQVFNDKHQPHPLIKHINPGHGFLNPLLGKL